MLINKAKFALASGPRQEGQVSGMGRMGRMGRMASFYILDEGAETDSSRRTGRPIVDTISTTVSGDGSIRQ